MDREKWNEYKYSQEFIEKCKSLNMDPDEVRKTVDASYDDEVDAVSGAQPRSNGVIFKSDGL